MLQKIKNLFIKHKTALILIFLLVLSAVAHGYNMFHFPYYENDEGTYMSQAWSLMTSGNLAPYTYWYDHAPAGWIFIALWVKITGGFFTFGTSVDSGRAFMFVLHITSSLLLFINSKRITKSNFASIVAVLVFSLSPLAIYFQRRVLLDNIMVFWVLLSLTYLLKEKKKLSQILLSAIFFGIAVLTKENAIFFTPAFIYILYSKIDNNRRITTIIKWLTVTGFTISFYLIYALLKGEFFPTGFNGDSTTHVSLVQTLIDQIDRGQYFGILDKRSDFYINLIEWLKKDSLTIFLGILATLLNILISIKEKKLRSAIVLVVCFSLFLIRGKLIIDFYIVPLIPFLALNIGIVANYFVKLISFNKRTVTIVLSLASIAAISYFLIKTRPEIYTKDETRAQINTINWIKTNISSSTNIIIDDSIYVDLHEKRFDGDPIFPRAEWASKIEMDPEVMNRTYRNDWKNVEYIILSHEILKQMKLSQNEFFIDSLKHSMEIQRFSKGSTSYTDISNLLSTNGDWMAIYKVKDMNNIILEDSWNFYKKNFIKSYGQVIDPQQNNNTTSEAQSYALLRAVYMNDKNTFDGVWNWTKDHMQYRTNDKIISWLWINNGNDSKLGDSVTASDADEDIALSLLFAYKKWGDEKYLSESKQIINDIWEKEVIQIKGTYYLTAGSDSEVKDGYLFNPSYLSPATYKIFAAVDAKHPWIKLSEDSYKILNRFELLPPNWVLLDKKSGSIKSASKYFKDENSGNYGYDAFRVFWRVSLDAKWFNNIEAKNYLNKISPFFQDELSKSKYIYAIYETDGNKVTNFDSLSTLNGAYSILNITSPNIANEIYQNYYESKYNYSGGFWDEKDNYYTQNWAWFTTLMNSNKMNNLW